MSKIKITIDFNNAERAYYVEDLRQDLQVGAHGLFEFCHPDHGEVAKFTILTKPENGTIANRQAAVVNAARQVVLSVQNGEYSKFGDLNSSGDLPMLIAILTEKIKVLDGD